MADPLEIELQETNKYFLQIESTMHDVIKFYSALVLGVITASIALAEMEAKTTGGTPLIPSGASKLRWLGFFWFMFAWIGYLALRYFLELRVRKIKMVDRLAAIREYLASRDGGAIATWLSNPEVFVTGVKQSPPYLRRPCGEWYLMLYLSAVNAVAIGFAVWAFRTARGVPWAALVGAIAFFGQFWHFTAHAYREDLHRERVFGKSQYGFLPHGKHLGTMWIFDRLARGIEHVVRRGQV